MSIFTKSIFLIGIAIAFQSQAMADEASEREARRKRNEAFLAAQNAAEEEYKECVRQLEGEWNGKLEVDGETFDNVSVRAKKEVICDISKAYALVCKLSFPNSDYEAPIPKHRTATGSMFGLHDVVWASGNEFRPYVFWTCYSEFCDHDDYLIIKNLQPKDKNRKKDYASGSVIEFHGKPFARAHAFYELSGDTFAGVLKIGDKPRARFDLRRAPE